MTVKKPFSARLKGKFYRVLARLIQWPRIKFYQFLSDAVVENNGAEILQPVLFTGKGKIVLGKCTLGSFPSPLFFSGYLHIEAREEGSVIMIGDGVHLNNAACLIAERTSITIEKNTLIGPEVCIFDSDFHNFLPSQRCAGTHQAKPVHIRENVFLGTRVTILKGVEIGNNSVVGATTLLTKNVPENVIVSGMPGYSQRDLIRK